MESPNWMRLAYELQDDPKGERTKIVARLPEFLSRGASALEIARKTGTKPDAVDAVLKQLAQYDLVKVQPSGLNVSFGDSLYSMTADGVKFFKLTGSASNKSAF